MARAIWTGAISFGLVNVPVKLFSATSPKTVRFHQLSAKTGTRIKQKRVDPSTGDEVSFDEIVKGYELSPDRYVLIDPDELDALDPKATKTIDIEEFVDLVDIDPIYYDHSYYLAPTTGGAKAYRLLLDAMREAGKVAIGRVVIRSKQQLCALRPTGDVITMSTMLFGDEVLAPDRIDELDGLSEAEASERELKMAQQLIASLSADFDPAKFKDDYRERVLDLIEKKAAGEEIAVQPQAEEPAAAPDLMAALEASLAEMRGGDSEPKSKANGATAKKKAPSRAKSSSGRGKPSGGSGNGASSSGGSGNGASSPGASKSRSGAGKSRAKAKS
ncbi:MAG TPA: Ku protein [Solirubrobacteraceae bacterium]|nr:Ku protein [Solirubrobacteraceae bacterium]